ncbi:hypothetical protein C8N31_101451 [Sulfitobacter mediterraneus]|uniref:Uncharacterized protein n=1 Tax=Sulfitobacter mediterraneus TaxID=83219 RepID=A0A2T6CJV1_9RHOB|nr:hypothetical protein C8N31_101451 [Sulfitobacter mediterraneus]
MMRGPRPTEAIDLCIHYDLMVKFQVGRLTKTSANGQHLRRNRLDVDAFCDSQSVF